MTTIQPDLFQHVLETYMASEGVLTNQALYAAVASRAGIDQERLTAQQPVGKSGQRHSVLKRAIRWHQQTLKAMRVLERVDGARGLWQLAIQNKKGLHEAPRSVKLVAFSTKLGVAVWGCCESVLAGLDMPISLVVTSPPYLIARGRAYGTHADEDQYIEFLVRAIEPIVRHLAPGGSIALNLTNDAFERGLPSRSLYRERLLLRLRSEFGLHLMDNLIWFNRSRPPSPVQWASKTRQQLNASYEVISWLCNDPSRVRANNRRVLEQHTARHMALMASGGEQRHASYADGNYVLRPGSFGTVTEGRIPRNVLERGHRCADTQRYRADAKALGLPIHGAMQPLSIPDFLIRLLTTEGDIVLDPFGGTVKTGMAAERLGRRWLVVERCLDYLRASAERFRTCAGFDMSPEMEYWPHRC